MSRLLALAAALGLIGAAPLAGDGWDQHLALRALGAGLRQPDGAQPLTVAGPLGPLTLTEPLAAHDWDSLGLVSLRDYGGWEAGAGLRLEWNLLAQAQDSSAGASPTAQPLGRSPVLERRLYAQDGRQVDLEADQLNLRWQGPGLGVVAGRQPVNLGQNFYFSPLDLFEPFQAQDSYRDFRAGVDALRATWSPGHFTQVEAIAVAGYQPQAQGSNSTEGALWLDGPQGQGSLLLRAQSGGDAWAATALGGRFASASVGGASIQLEGLGSSWTLEGLYGRRLNAPMGLTVEQAQLTLGWTRQLDAALDARIELSQQAAQSLGPAGAQQGWIHLAAASLNYQASPLWTLTPAVFWYGDNGQAVALADAGWSASENGTLHLLLSLPLILSDSGRPGGAPTAVQRQPSAFSVDYRWTL
jgi:hypothetical protein